MASENDSEMESLEGNVETADSFDEGFDVHDPDVFNDDVPEEVNDVMDKVMNTFQDKINQSRMKSVYNANDLANIELYQMLQASGARYLNNFLHLYQQLLCKHDGIWSHN